uniref:Immunoglobulin C1-set domain-containing protein n=1 Tax=Sarcophilus harrisii TaxID=9305 RepID=A0A7N4NS94_SARHA
LGNPLSPSVFLVRSQDAMACLIRNFYPKEIHVSLASSGPLISAQTHTLGPMANGNYNAIQIGRVGENHTVTCTVKHIGKEMNMTSQVLRDKTLELPLARNNLPLCRTSWV